MGKLAFKSSLILKLRLRAAWLRHVEARRNPGMAYSPFLLTGPPRSGTSLLTALMARKPNVLVVNEPVVVGDPLMKRGRPVDLVRGYMNLVVREALATGTMMTQVDPESPGQSTTDTANRGAVRYRVNVDVDRSRPLCVGIKHPIPFMECLEELVTGWPELKVLISIRDPLPTIRSWRETGYGWQPGLDDPRFAHGRRLYRMVPATDNELERRAHLWRILVEQAKEWGEKRPQQVHVFRYERLLAHPAETMSELFSFIGAPDSAAPIDVSDVRPQSRDRYKGLTGEESELIERVVGGAASDIA